MASLLIFGLLTFIVRRAICVVKQNRCSGNCVNCKGCQSHQTLYQRYHEHQP